MKEPVYVGFSLDADEKKRKIKLVVRILLCLLLLLVIGALIAGAVIIHRYYSLLDYQEVSSQESVPEPVELDHVLVVGLDVDDPEGGSRTDTMILVTINPETKEMTLTSFLRDLYVDIPDHGEGRLGYAYAKGGMSLLQRTMRVNFGINVDRYVTIDFEAFRAIVDAVGGLELELDETALKYVFPGEEKEPGTYLLNGQQALVQAYWIENRDDEGRTLRQRTIMTKGFEKICTISTEELDAILVETLPKVTTNLTESDCYSVLFGLMALSRYPLSSQQFPFEGTYESVDVDGVSVLTFDLEENKKLFFDSVS